MKKSFPSFIKTLLFNVLFCIAFTSCQNFMKGSEIRDEITDIIKYNNTPSCTIILKSENTMGEFLAQKETAKIGYPIEIQYELNTEDYVFEKLEAVNQNDKNISLADYVELELLNVKKGIYKYKITLLKKSDEILIRPVCKLIPKLKTNGISPKLESSGCEQDYPIEITFNKGLNSEILEKYKDCISITADGEDLWDHFDTPYFKDENNETLVIPVLLNNLILEPDGTKSIQNIEIIYDFSKVKDIDGFTVNSSGTHQYRIKKEFKGFEEVTLNFSADENEGKFLSTTDKKCFVNYTVDIQFEIKNSEDYQFINFIAKDSKTGTVLTDSDIGFEYSEKTGQKAVAKVRVKKFIPDNVLIYPVCIALPKITEFYPSFNPNGYDQDTTLKITFNKSVDINTFSNILNFSKLTISSGAEILNSYYQTPYFTDNNTVLNIPTVKGKNIVSTANNSTKDLELVLDLSGTKDADGIDIAVDSSIKTYNFRLNSKKDTTPPVVSDCHVYSTSDTTSWYYRELTDKKIEQWSREATDEYVFGDYSHNHVHTLYVRMQGYDKDSGIKCIRVNETLLKNINEEDVSNKSVTLTTDYGSSFLNYTTDETGKIICSGSINHEFKTTETGLVKVDIYLIDNADTQSIPKTYYVIYENSLTLMIYGGTSDSLNDLLIPYNNETQSYEANIHFDNTVSMSGPFYSSDMYSPYRLSIFAHEENNNKIQLLNNKILEPYNGVYAYSEINPALNTALESFTRNPLLTTYIVMAFQNEAGIIYEQKMEIPKSFYISYLDTVNWEVTIENDEYKPDCYYYDTYTKYFYTYQENLTSAPSQPQAFTYIMNLSSKPDGIYNIYAYKQIAFMEPLLWFSLNAYSSCCKPYIYYKGISNPNSGAVTFPDFNLPDADSIEYTRNTGTAKFNIDIDFPEDNYNYAIKFSYIDNNNTVDESDDKEKVVKICYSTDIEVPNGYNMKVSIIAMDSNGTIIAESTKKNLNLTQVDNIPPVLSLINYNDEVYIEPNCIGIKNIPCDYKPQTKSHEYNIKKIEYYLTPTYSRCSSKLDAEKIAYRKGIITQEIPFSSSDIIMIPLDGMEMGAFDIWLYVEDNSALKNYYWGCPEPNTTNSGGSAHYISKASLSYEYDTDKITIKTPVYSSEKCDPDGIKMFIANNNDEIFETYYQVSYIENNQWKNDSGLIKMTTISDDNVNYSADITYPGAIMPSESFIKINSLYKYDYSFITVSHWEMVFKPLIIYPEYYIRLAAGNPIICDSKNIFPLANGFQIFCDAPVFVHTIICPEKLTDTSNTKEDALTWESNGREIAIKTYYPSDNTSYTYASSNYNDIPSGYYYTTIFHFADGDIVMSEIKQK